MKSQRDLYMDHVDELVDGLMKEQKKKMKVERVKKGKMKEIVMDGITYKEFLQGRKIKTIRVLGLEFTRKVKFSDPSNFQKPLILK